MASPPSHLSTSPTTHRGHVRPRHHASPAGRRSTSPRDPTTATSRPVLPSYSSTLSPSTATTPARIGVRRLAALHGTQDRVVLDLGARMTIVGFSGEARPRAIVPSHVVPLVDRTACSVGGASPAYPSSTSLQSPPAPGPEPPSWDGHWTQADAPLWTSDLARHPTDLKRNEAQHLLEARIEESLRSIYAEYVPNTSLPFPVLSFLVPSRSSGPPN